MSGPSFRKSNFVMPGQLMAKAGVNFAENQAKKMMGNGNPNTGADIRPAGSTSCPTCGEYHRLGNICKNLKQPPSIIKAGVNMGGGDSTAVMKKPALGTSPPSPSSSNPTKIEAPKPQASPSLGNTVSTPKPSFSVPKPSNQLSGTPTAAYKAPSSPSPAPVVNKPTDPNSTMAGSKRAVNLEGNTRILPQDRAREASSRINEGGNYIRQRRGANILGQGQEFKFDPNKDTSHYSNDPDYMEGRQGAWSGHAPTTPLQTQTDMSQTQTSMAPPGMSGPSGTKVIDRSASPTRLGGHADIPSQADYNRNTVAPSSSPGGLQALAQDSRTARGVSSTQVPFSGGETQADMYAPAVAKDNYNQQKMAGKTQVSSQAPTMAPAENDTQLDMYAPAVARDRYKQSQATPQQSSGGATPPPVGNNLPPVQGEIPAAPVKPTSAKDQAAINGEQQSKPINIPFSSAFQTGMSIGSGLDRPGGAIGPTTNATVSGVHNALSNTPPNNANQQRVAQQRQTDSVNNANYLQNLAAWQQKYGGQAPKQPAVQPSMKGKMNV